VGWQGVRGEGAFDEKTLEGVFEFPAKGGDWERGRRQKLCYERLSFRGTGTSQKKIKRCVGDAS